MVTLSEALKMNRRELLALAITSAAVTAARAQTPSPADYRQLLAGRDETIIEPEIPIIDAHHHLFVRPGLRYMIDDYLADARAGHRIVASVYVETLAFARPDGPEVLRPLGEIEFANGVGAMCASGVLGDCRACAAIVGLCRSEVWRSARRVARSRDGAGARALPGSPSSHPRTPVRGALPIHPKPTTERGDEVTRLPSRPSHISSSAG